MEDFFINFTQKYSTIFYQTNEMTKTILTKKGDSIIIISQVT